MRKIKPDCPNCNGLGQLDKYHREWICNMCNGTGTTDKEYIAKVERLRAEALAQSKEGDK